MLHKEMLAAAAEENVPGMVRARLTISKCSYTGSTDDYGFVSPEQAVVDNGTAGGELTPREGYAYLTCFRFKNINQTRATRPFRYDGVDYPAEPQGGTPEGEDKTHLYSRWSTMVGQTVTVYLTPGEASRALAQKPPSTKLGGISRLKRLWHSLTSLSIGGLCHA